MVERAFEMCLNKPKGKIHIVLIHALVRHLQPNTLSRQKLLPVDIMFLKKQLGIMLRKGAVWELILKTNKLSKNVDPYACAILAKNTFLLLENGGIYPERNFSSYLLFYQERRWFCKWLYQLYKLNIVHRLFHLVDWKFHCCLNFRARNRRQKQKLCWFSLWLRLQWY